MKVIVCFGEMRVLVPCEGSDMTVKDLTEQAVARYKKATNKSADEEVKVVCLKTQSEGAVVDPDDKVHGLAEDKDIFTAVCDEPFTQLVNANNGQVVLAVISNDGTINPDSILHTMQLNQFGSSMANLSPLFSNAVGMLQQSMSQQGTGNPVNALMPAVPALEDESQLGVEERADQDDKDGKSDFKCNQCPKKFKKSSKLRQHLIAHARQEEMKKYECDKCAASFGSEWLWLRHAKIHEGTGKPRFCLVCNRAFRGSTDLKVHMRVHTGEKPFKCEHCPKAFGDRSALRRHNMTHTGLKPRPCPHCPLAFRQTAPLIQHMRMKHNVSILHRCDVCFMSFCEDETYVLHMANVHNKSVSIAIGDEDDVKKEEGQEAVDGELAEMQHEGMETSGGEATDGEVATMIEDGGVEEEEHGDKNENEVEAEHLVQRNEEQKDDDQEVVHDEQEVAHDEQEVAERSIQEGFMAEAVEQGHRITITRGQENQEIVLPSELIVAHQLIAVQQSNVEEQ